MNMKPLARHLKNEKKSHRFIIYIVIIIVIACIFIGFWSIFLRQDTKIFTSKSNISQESTVVEKNENSISIPGYEGITLKADSLQQDIALHNPTQNTCYFVISLYLEDGTLLWESDYIEPGNNSDPIVLTQALEKGNYPNAVLKYSCFKMDPNKSPLNGAQTKLTLRVK